MFGASRPPLKRRPLNKTQGISDPPWWEEPPMLQFVPFWTTPRAYVAKQTPCKVPLAHATDH